ncbi:MAG: hypothetical protein HND52_07660 [Ignavibacteriae bacterium]|nr:hypothetical protein [Ignavibacteriota bacterium]
MKTFKMVVLSVLLFTSSYGQQAWNFDESKTPQKSKKEFQFLAYFFTQGVMNNVYAKNDFLKGQTVGRLFGGNTSTTGEQAFYFEQRILPFIIYQPNLLDGKAILRMAFEIDWTWGDASYGAGGNFGSAFSADQVNLQTQNIELELLPWKGWAINLGLQRLFDTPYNPYRTFVSTMTNTAYRLAFWGSDAVGLTVRYDRDYDRFKAGYYQLYENNIQQPDDVVLWEFMYEREITPAWSQGFAAWYIYDRGNGEGGVSILGQGLNSLLNNYNGTYSFPIGGNPYKADIFWLGTHGNYNPEFTMGRWTLNGFFVSNIGKVRTEKNGEYSKAFDILGFTGNLRTGYKYGQTSNDAVIADIIFTSGDEDFKDDTYNGVLTGNMWGSPGAIFISHGAYLLYPHGNVVNRFISAVSDISNLGLGQIGGTLNLHKDFIPNKLNAKVGLAASKSIYEPKNGGSFIGLEANAKISYQTAVFMNIELHGAYLWLGDFYDSPEMNGGENKKPSNPYTFFMVFKWLLF